jgi:predicted DNA-binding protein (MmcQ/YjbR family)
MMRRADARFDRAVFKGLRRVCLALPETAETSSWGHPNFRAGKRTFCAFELFGGRPSIALRVAPAAAKQLARRRHFFLTPYGRGVWVSRWLDVGADAKSLAALIDRSYRQVAPRKLVRLLDSRTTIGSRRTRTSSPVARK